MILQTLESGICTGKADVSGIRPEELVVESVWEARLQRVGMKVGNEKKVDEVVHTAVAGESSAVEDDVVASVENGCGLGLDCFTCKQEREDIAVRLLGCCSVFLMSPITNI